MTYVSIHLVQYIYHTGELRISLMHGSEDVRGGRTTKKPLSHSWQTEAFSFSLYLSGSPESVTFRTVFKTYSLQSPNDLGFVDRHIIAQGVERRIAVTQFHVDEAV